MLIGQGARRLVSGAHAACSPDVSGLLPSGGISGIPEEGTGNAHAGEADCAASGSLPCRLLISDQCVSLPTSPRHLSHRNQHGRLVSLSSITGGGAGTVVGGAKVSVVAPLRCVVVVVTRFVTAGAYDASFSKAMFHPVISDHFVRFRRTGFVVGGASRPGLCFRD